MNLILTLLYMGLVFIVSVIQTPGGVDPFTGFDKVVHFIIYAIMGLLWARVFLSGRSPVLKRTLQMAFLKALAVTFVSGLFMELVQGGLPTRDASLFDAIANGAGGGTGAFLYCLIHRYISRR